LTLRKEKTESLDLWRHYSNNLNVNRQERNRMKKERRRERERDAEIRKLWMKLKLKMDSQHSRADKNNGRKMTTKIARQQQQQ